MTTITVEDLDVDGAPQIGVTIADLDPGSVDISVQVTWDDGETWRTITGGDHRTVSGSDFIRDFFAPLNVAASYRVIEHSLSDAVTESDPITVVSETTWLQDPLNPRTPVQVDCGFGTRWFAEGSFSEATFDQPADIALVLGADRAVASVGQRQAATGVPLTIRHEVGADEGNELRSLLMQAGLLVMRGHPVDVLDPVATIIIGPARESLEEQWKGTDDTFYQVATWSLSVSQVRPSSRAVLVPWLTYDELAAAWSGSTYDDLAAVKSGLTYAEFRKDPLP